MDEQTNPAVEPATASPDPVTQPAGEANTAIPATSEPNNAQVEAPQAEPVEVPTEQPTSVPETAQNEPISEAMQASPETQTAQLAGNEPLPEHTPSTEVLTDAPEVPTPASAPIPETSPPEEIPPQAPTQTQQGTAQPEPPPTEPPLPAQAPTVSSTQTAPSIVGLLFEKAKLTIQLRKQKKLLKILELLTKKGKITNDDVEKLLRVSDATATRYLSELEKQGKISQSGKTGRAVTYTKR